MASIRPRLATATAVVPALVLSACAPRFVTQPLAYDKNGTLIKANHDAFYGVPVYAPKPYLLIAYGPEVKVMLDHIGATTTSTSTPATPPTTKKDNGGGGNKGNGDNVADDDGGNQTPATVVRQSATIVTTVMLPDLSRPYAVGSSHTGGDAEMSITLVNGILTKASLKGDAQVDEAIEQAASFVTALGGLVPGLGGGGQDEGEKEGGALSLVPGPDGAPSESVVILIDLETGQTYGWSSAGSLWPVLGTPDTP